MRNVQHAKACLNQYRASLSLPMATTRAAAQPADAPARAAAAAAAATQDAADESVCLRQQLEQVATPYDSLRQQAQQAAGRCTALQQQALHAAQKCAALQQQLEQAATDRAALQQQLGFVQQAWLQAVLLARVWAKQAITWRLQHQQHVQQLQEELGDQLAALGAEPDELEDAAAAPQVPGMRPSDDSADTVAHDA